MYCGRYLRIQKIINILVILLFLCGIASAADNLAIDEILITEGRTYHKTKTLWKNVYYDLVKNNKSVRGATYIAPIKGNGYSDSKHKNGARDTIIFVPKQTKFNKEVDVVFYFHGLGGFKKRDFKTRVLRHTKAIEKQAKNYIIVISEMPWSKNTTTPRSRQGRVFNRRGQFSTYVNSIIKVVISLFEQSPIKRNNCMIHNMCQFNFGNIILIGHSAGGSTLMSISKSGGLDWLYEKKNVTGIKIIFSDAGYGYWTDVTWKYFKLKGKNTNTEFILLTRKWDKPYRHTIRFLKRFNIIPNNIRHIVFNRKLITHADIGDKVFTWIYPTNESGCGEGVE